MCHNAPWLSALDKQMRLQFVPKESKADVMVVQMAVKVISLTLD